MRGHDILIKTRKVPESATVQASHRQREGWCDVRTRNLHTIKSALIRGDKQVTLWNWTHVPSHEWNHIRLAHEEIDKVRVEAYPILPVTHENPDRNGKLQPDARKDIESQSWQGLKFNFVKVLARGGQGYVSLWDVTFDDGSIKKVVIKKAVRSSFNPEKEVGFHLRYTGAEHTTQIVDLAQESKDIHRELLGKDSKASVRFTAGKPWDAGRMKCVVFEYAPYGDVWRLMETLVPKRRRFPNQVLWGIMECFAMGLATVSYTPTFEVGKTFETEFSNAVQIDQVNDLLDHAEKAWYSTNDIHQDLEALNVLLGEGPSHESQPIFKLHDLGAFSKHMAKEWRRITEFGIWRLRHSPKSHAITPEQVSKEWDNLPIRCSSQQMHEMFCSPDLRKGTRCAGRYGTWTNVFLVAKVMESMITTEIERHPFRPKPHKKPDGSTGPQTYGWVLQEQLHSWVDPELRNLICMCLYENPADRPSPLDIMRVVQKWKDSGRRNSTEIAQWWEGFHGPRPVSRHKPKVPNANFNATRQAVIDQLGLLALYSGGQPNPTKTSKRRQAAALNQSNQAAAGPSNQQHQGPVQANQGGASPQLAPPPRPQQPTRPTKLRVPKKIAGTRNNQVSPQPLAQPGDARPLSPGGKALANLPAQSQKRPRVETPRKSGFGKIPKLTGTRLLGPRGQLAGRLGSGSTSPFAFQAANVAGGPNNAQQSPGAASHSPAIPVVVAPGRSSRIPPSSLLVDVNRNSPAPALVPAIQPPSLSGTPLAQPRTAIQKPSDGVGSGEAMDIDREEAAYRLGDNGGNTAARVPPAQGRNNTRSGRSSGDLMMSINRATQRPIKSVRFESPLKPPKKLKIHKKRVSPKVQKVIPRPGPKKTVALEACVRDAVSRMPVAVGNLLSRTKELKAHLDIDAVPVYAYLK